MAYRHIYLVTSNIFWNIEQDDGPFESCDVNKIVGNILETTGFGTGTEAFELLTLNGGKMTLDALASILSKALATPSLFNKFGEFSLLIICNPKSSSICSNLGVTSVGTATASEGGELPNSGSELVSDDVGSGVLNSLFVEG